MAKTSLSIDRAKAEAAARILGTTTLTATVDSALDEVIRLQRKRDLVERITRDGGLGPDDDARRRLRTP